jgi:hypothetical protein
MEGSIYASYERSTKSCHLITARVQVGLRLFGELLYDKRINLAESDLCPVDPLVDQRRRCIEDYYICSVYSVGVVGKLVNHLDAVCLVFLI